MSDHSPEAARLAKMSPEELCAEFTVISTGVEAQYKRLGRIYYFLQQKLGNCTGQIGVGPTVMLKQCGAANTAMLSSAIVAARGFALVVDGKLSESDWLDASRAKLNDLCRDKIKPRMSCRTVERATVSREVELLGTPVQSLDEGKSMQRASKALAVAQEWLIEARTSWPDDSPEEYDRLMTSALQFVGRLRFALTEAMNEARAA